MQRQNTLIYNKKFLTILFGAFLILGSTCSFDKSYAVEYGAIKYNDAFIDYSKIDKDETLKKADYYFNKALTTREEKQKKDFLLRASGEYFILGDNRNNSEDSRYSDIGNINKKYIVGKVWFVISPKDKFGFLKG